MSTEEILRLLDELGERLGPTGERVFQLAVQRVILSSVVGIVLGAGTLVLFALVLRWLYRKWMSNGNDWDIPLGMFGMVGGVASLGAVVLVAVNVLSLLTPEYTALRELLQAIR